MSNLVRFTPTKLAEWKKKGKQSFYYFERGLLGDEDLNPKTHLDLCNFLQFNPSRRRLICGFRGSLKSSVLIAYFWWRGLYIVNWSSMLVEQRFENAKAHHERLQAKFRYGARAGLLQDIYSDRLPPGMEGWTTERTLLVRTDPNAEPFCTIGSLDGKLESAHRNCIGCDDLEGADADKSDVPNEDSERFVIERAEPLLRNPSEDEIIVTGTPHGKNPLVHKLLENPEWATWWKPMLDKNGKSQWPERFTPEWIAAKQEAIKVSTKARRMWDMQYLLLKSTTAMSVFDMASIRGNLYSFQGGRLITYPCYEREKNPRTGEVELNRKEKAVDLSACRIYIHGDPGHKSPEERKSDDRPSMWAWIVVAISPDFHAFVVETWMEYTSYDVYLSMFLRLYKKWAPYQWTFEQIGAQSWLLAHLRIHEKNIGPIESLSRVYSPGTRRLPRPSTRLNDDRPRELTKDKEEWITSQLEIPINMAWLHFHESQTTMLEMLEMHPSEQHPNDGIDALSQGPGVWQPPTSPEAMKAMKRREDEMRLLNLVEPLTGYRRPWKDIAA